MSEELARVHRFQRDFNLRKARRTIEVPGGVAVLNDRFPASHDDNKLIIWAGDDPAAAVLAADEALAGLGHRYVHVLDDELGAAFAPAFTAAGYEHSPYLTMVFRGQVPAGVPAADELGLDEMISVLRANWRETLPGARDEEVEALALRIQDRVRGAATVAFRGVRAPDGEVAARADLYVHDDIAQIESVYTAERHRGKGHARTLMQSMLAEAAGATLIFLYTGTDNWARDFYTRLGFEPLGRTHGFLRIE
ncbi:GNAT family N-acetyltransferase [Nonomuraea sp. NPDC059007]|uniref:GNAT family N-acetyltransferase n=1 Tax=Nonomuraea sp. NPDC059007 TaxID=3346692 RepID=UPI0036C5992A